MKKLVNIKKLNKKQLLEAMEIYYKMKNDILKAMNVPYDKWTRELDNIQTIITTSEHNLYDVAGIIY